MNNQQNVLIDECRKLIENQLAWGSSEQWKQRDFEQLSDLICEKTGTRLSLSTLKRIWSCTFTNTPQLATLNALAQYAGMLSWHDFRIYSKQYNHQDTEPENPIKKRNHRKLFIGFSTLLFLLIPVLFIFTKNIMEKRETIPNLVKLKPEVAFEYKMLADGIPNTVVFSFDLKSVKADSFFFQQTWDYKTRVSIPAKSYNFTSIYYYPGYHTAKLFAGKTQIAEQRVHIKTNGWEGLIYSGSTEVMPTYFKDTIADGLLYLPLKNLPKTVLSDRQKDYFIRYYNIRNFDGLSGDNFKLTSKIKNDIEHGGLTCQNVTFYLYCESGMIIIPFSMPGCVGNLNLVAGDNFLPGQNNDLSALGINLSNWQNITISSNQKTIRIKTSSKQISVPYQKQIGLIKGLMIEFKGTGMVDYLVLEGSTGIKKYTWNF